MCNIKKTQAVSIINVTSEEYKAPPRTLKKEILSLGHAERLGIDLEFHRLTENGRKIGVDGSILVRSLEVAYCRKDKPPFYIEDIEKLRSSRHAFLLEILEGMTIVRSLDDLFCEGSRDS